MVDMAGNGHARLRGEVTEHAGQHRQGRVAPASGPGLKDDRQARLLRRLDEGNGVLPAQHHEPGHRMAAFFRGIEQLAQGGNGHLNFAIMSLMPGMVSTW